MAAFLLVVLALVGTYALVTLARTAVAVRRDVDGDAPGVLLTLACRHLPADRADWGRALLAELASVDGSAARWRFAGGGLRAAVSARLAGRRAGRASLALVWAGAVAGEGLAVAALVGYPALRADRKAALLLAVLTVVLGGYVAVAAARARDAGPGARPARRLGVLAGGVLGVVWFVFATAWWDLHSWPLVAAALIPVAAGVLAAGSAGGTRAGITSVTWAALVAGLAVFVALVVDALATAAGPYDTGQLQEYARSGYPSVAAYWVGEGLATSFLLLLMASALTMILGAVGALVGGRAAAVAQRRPR